jgi:hypothetical protein
MKKENTKNCGISKKAVISSSFSLEIENCGFQILGSYEPSEKEKPTLKEN